MWQDGKHHLQIFHRPLGAARQVEDERPFADAGDDSGEHGMSRDLEAGGAHRLRQTGCFPFDDGARGFGSDIVRGKAGAASGEDNIQFAAVCPFRQGRADG